MKIQAWQKKQIHTLKGKLGLDDATYRAVLAGYGVSSSVDLDDARANQLIDDLATKAAASGVWEKRPGRRGHKGRPHNIIGGKSRNLQIKKIEALLTTGKKPWAYAEAIAKKVCKNADGVAFGAITFVPDDLLYKIIAALTYQAKREEWDLDE